MSKYEVVCIGHVLMDIRLLVDKLPGPDQEAAIEAISYGAGGSAANVANAVIRLGHKSAIIAKIGMDNLGRLIHEELSLKRIGLEGLRIDSEDGTGFSIVVVDSKGKVVLFGNKGAAERLEPNELNKKLIEEARVVHIASLRLDTSITAAKMAKEGSSIVTWDPGRRLALLGIKDKNIKALLNYVDYILLNRREAAALTGRSNPREAAAILLNHSTAKAVIIKMGSEGAILVTHDTSEQIPAFKVKAVDTTGAGDTFAAGFIIGLLENMDLKQAVEFANASAAIKVTRLGAQSPPLREEVELLLKHYKYFNKMIL